jgi:ADP-ribosylglycohydrolase
VEVRQIKDKFQGCLIGGAIGDALGYIVEFMSIGEIKRRFGVDGIRDLVCDNMSGKALISDDTQMTLFTAEGLLWADYRGRHKGISSYEGCVFYSYQRWLYTQTRRLASQEYNWILDNDELVYKSDLLSVQELFARRAPGNTCLTALSGSINQKFGLIGRPMNNSKGCGGVMRVAPVGLYFYNSPERAFKVAAECAAITHGHPSGYLSAGVLATIIAEIIAGKELKRATMTSIEILKTYEGHEECLDILNKVLHLLDADMEAFEAVRQIGEGWVGEEALAIALYCALKYPNDFKEALWLSVNHSGDSDSTGAICGNILGAYLCIKRIPEKWVNGVEIADVILKMADKISSVVG